jgi:uncharacterized membrane protein YkvA (DUF1232 family)
MAARISALLSRPALLRTLAARSRLAWRLVREPTVPMWLKAALALPLLYVASPVDVLPDFLPVLGQLDDLGVILFGLELFVRYCQPEVVAFHRNAIEAGRPYSPIPGNGVVIDAEWRRE